jgi:sirohydrochlorin cobaltochelatase
MTATVVLIAHGSRAPGTREAHGELAARLASALGTPVMPAFLEITPPDIPTAIDRAAASGAGEVVLVPYLLLGGNHTTRDIPLIIEQARGRHPGLRLALTPPLGPDDRLVAICVDRARAALDASLPGSGAS